MGGFLMLDNEARDNTDYRKVFHTGKHVQFVLYSLKPGEDIPREVHESETQVIHVVTGTLRATIGDKVDEAAAPSTLLIEPGTPHVVANGSSDAMLKFWSMYTPPVFETRVLGPHCRLCGKLGAKYSCAECHGAHYCSASCQEQDWESSHQRECVTSHPEA